MSVPSDSNISAKEFEKKSYQLLQGHLGMIIKGTKKYVNEIPENLSLAEIQKIVLNNTAHILRRNLSL